MRKFLPLATLTAALICLPTAGLAGDGNSRLSIGYTHYEAAGGDVGLLTGRYAYYPLRFLGVEAELGTGIVDEEFTANGMSADIGVDISYGLFANAQIPFHRYGSSIFVRGGYQQTDISVTSGDNEISSDVDGFAYGGGVNLMLTEHHGVRLDYTRLEGENDANADTYSISYVLRF